MTDGAGCVCCAHHQGECACGADWTPKEVVELRRHVKVLVEALTLIKNAGQSITEVIAEAALDKLPEQYRV